MDNIKFSKLPEHERNILFHPGNTPRIFPEDGKYIAFSYADIVYIIDHKAGGGEVEMIIHSEIKIFHCFQIMAA